MDDARLAHGGPFVTGPSRLFSEKLHVGCPNLGDRGRLLARFENVLDRRWLTNDGLYVQALEHQIAEYLGVQHCVAVCSATIGLQIAIRALGLTGEVIVPSFTFPATAHALAWQGIAPAFCDVDPVTHNIDPGTVERLIGPRTTGILAVHLWGNPCDVDALTEIAERRGLELLFDAAHAFGCSYRGRMIGNFGHAEVFSFHATKFVSAGEGGAIVTNDDELANKMRRLRNFGLEGRRCRRHWHERQDERICRGDGAHVAGEPGGIHRAESRQSRRLRRGPGRHSRPAVVRHADSRATQSAVRRRGGRTTRGGDFARRNPGGLTLGKCARQALLLSGLPPDDALSRRARRRGCSAAAHRAIVRAAVAVSHGYRRVPRRHCADWRFPPRADRWAQEGGLGRAIMDDVKVSVCMVTYNHERYIAQAVESVLVQQTTFPIEIVIGEDCSTDSTRSILRGLARRHPGRLQLRLANRNEGGKTNFMGAFAACRGQYVAMLEGDDYWCCPTKLQMQADALDARPDWAICFHPAKCIYEDGLQGPAFLPENWQRTEATLVDLFEQNFISTNSVMFRNRLFPAFPPWFKEHTVGDWPLHILNAEHGNIGFLPDVMSAYRIHAHGIWAAEKLSTKLVCIFELLTALDHHFAGKYSREIDEYRLNTLRWVTGQLEAAEGDSKDFASLQSAHNRLEENFVALQSTYKRREEDFNSLEANYKRVEEKFVSLHSTYNRLEEDLLSLHSACIRLAEDSRALRAFHDSWSSSLTYRVAEGVPRPVIRLWNQVRRLFRRPDKPQPPTIRPISKAA